MAETPAENVNTNGVSPAAQEKQIEETPGVKVFAGNLAYSVNDEGLKAFFAPVASDILSCQVVLRGTRSAGYGFVAVTSTEVAQKAVEALNGKDLEGRAAIVEVAKPAEQKAQEKSERKAKRRVSRRGSKPVPGEVTEAEANGEAEKPSATTDGEGDVAKPKKKKKNVRKLKNKVKSAITGENGDAAETGAGAGAIETAETEKKRSPKPKRAPKPRRPVGEEPTGEQSKTTLFVANLPFTLEDAGLGSIFTDAGFKVTSAHVVRRRWGHPRKSKGYGFVELADEEEQKKALEALQGKELEGGRQIAVKIAVNAAYEDGSDAAEGEKAQETSVAA